jgi:proliferating cell nuclear antigen PCNA
MGYILEAKTVQTYAFKTVIETLRELLIDVNFYFSPTTYEEDNDDESVSEEYSDEQPADKKIKKIGGLKIMTMNKNRSVLVHLKLDANKFDYYVCKKKKIICGVNMSEFYKRIKTINNNDILTLAIDEDNVNKLIIKFENGDKNCKVVHKLNLMDLDVQDIQISPVKFPYCINMQSTDFHKICKDMYSLSEKMEIKCVNKKIYFTGKGEMGSVEVDLGESENGLSIDVYQDEIVQGLFKLKNLVLFTKCTNLCNTVTLFLKNDYPLVVRYAVAALGEIKLCLSAKIDD